MGDKYVNASSDWNSKIMSLTPEKRARYQTYHQVLNAFGSPSQSLFVVDNDDEFNVFLNDFNSFLRLAEIVPEESTELPYYVIKIGYDGDMLDDMFRVALSLPRDALPESIDPFQLYSKQQIFQYLYNIITRDKFVIFHISEFPLAYYFETAVVVDVESLSDVLDPTVHDETILRYLNDLREQGAEEHRRTYSFFYRISTSLLMELSNAFLVVPTAGMNKHIVVTSWRTQTLLLGFSPLTWSSGSFQVYDLSGRDIDARWAFPCEYSNDPRVKKYVSLVPIKRE